ncbi:glycosyltransferase family 2 protein (plasmid) [Ensifer adhaerens]
MKKRQKISILVPAYNEEANVRRAHEAIVDMFRSLPEYDREIIFTDNHSTDKTFEILTEIASEDPSVRVIRFSRNIGYQRSLLVAYKAATGDCSVQIDCDLQDPPHLIPGMIDLWLKGHQVVYGIRRTLTDGWLTTHIRRAFYWCINALSEDDLPLNAGEFRLVDRCILDELRKVDDTSPYLRGLISAMGFSQVGSRIRPSGPCSRRKQVPVQSDALACRRWHSQPFADAAAARLDGEPGDGHCHAAASVRLPRRQASVRAGLARRLRDDHNAAFALHHAQRDLPWYHGRVCGPHLHAIEAPARPDHRSFNQQ